MTTEKTVTQPKIFKFFLSSILFLSASSIFEASFQISDNMKILLFYSSVIFPFMFSFSPNKLLFDSALLLTFVVIVFLDLAKAISLLLGIITYSNLITDLDLDEDTKMNINIFIRFFYLSLALFGIRLFLKKREVDLDK